MALGENDDAKAEGGVGAGGEGQEPGENRDRVGVGEWLRVLFWCGRRGHGREWVRM